MNGKQRVRRILRKHRLLVGVFAGLVVGSCVVVGFLSSSFYLLPHSGGASPIAGFTSTFCIPTAPAERFEVSPLSSEGAFDVTFASGTPVVFLLSPNGGESWQGTNPINWTAIDPQSDPLSYTLYYSPDGGIHWIKLTTGLTESVYAWDTETIEDGTAYLIKVEASNGQYTGVDISDAPFAIANGTSLFEQIAHLLSGGMRVALGAGVFAALALLGAALKARSLPPPLQGKRSWKDAMQRLLWYLLYPFILIFSHVLYDPVIRRLKQEDVTKNATRQAILRLLGERGVAHFREIERAVVGEGFFMTQWHLQVLDDFNHVRHKHIGPNLVYYLRGFGGGDPRTIEIGFLLKQQTTRDVLAHIRAHPGTYASEIARNLRRHPTTIREHLLKLEAYALLTSVLDGRMTRLHFSEENNDLIDSLLSQIKPES